MSDARQVGARVEELLGILQSQGGEATARAAEELVRLLLGLYGDGLSRIMAALRAEGAAGAAVLDRLLADPLVESLLLLHDLHPLDVDTRIQRALDQVRPYLGSHAGGVTYLGVTEEGVAQLRLEGSCDGCPSSTVTVQLAIKGAIEDAAPEVTEVVVEGVTPPPGPETLLQIGRRPPGAGGQDGTPAAAGDARWVTIPDIGPPSSRPVTAVAAGTRVLLCSVRGTLYAYRDACAVCGMSLAGGNAHARRAGLPGLRDPVRRPVCGPEPRRRGRAPGSAPVAGRQPGGQGRGHGAAGGDPVVSRPSGLRKFVGPPAPAPGQGAPAPLRPGGPAPRPRCPGLARLAAASPRSSPIRFRPLWRPARPRRMTPGNTASSAPPAYRPNTGTWRTWSSPASPAPAGPATCSSPHPKPGGGDTAPSRIGICGIRPGRCPPWSGTSCRSRSGWRSS